MRILAVDDDPIFLELLTLRLNASGWNEVTLAGSPADALPLLEEDEVRFDCILTDFQMPGMDGAELCRRIRDLPAYRQVPIVMITSVSDRPQIDRAFAMGATDFISKPIDATELRARMTAVARLVAEQARTRWMEQRILEQQKALTPEFVFETPIRVPEFDRGIDLVALQNYLLTLGVRGLFTVAAGAICIENGALIFRMTDPPGFRSVLSDVAAVIEDALKAMPILMAYAGGGRFVGVLTGHGDWDVAALEAELAAGMEAFAPVYAADRLPLPRLRVGPVLRNALYAPTRPLRILDRAMMAAGTKGPLGGRRPRQAGLA